MRVGCSDDEGLVTRERGLDGQPAHNRDAEPVVITVADVIG